MRWVGSIRYRGGKQAAAKVGLQQYCAAQLYIAGRLLFQVRDERATAPGFQAYVVPGFTLQVNEVRTIDV